MDNVKTVYPPQTKLRVGGIGPESKPRNSDFSTKTTFCQHGNTKRKAHILSKSRSSRPIRTPLKSINHASKYRIHEIYHFTEIRDFAMKKMPKMS